MDPAKQWKSGERILDTRESPLPFSYYDENERPHPLAELHDRKDLLALTPEELQYFIQEVRGGQTALPLVVKDAKGVQKLDMTPLGFFPLQQYLLQSRLFVTVSTLR